MIKYSRDNKKENSKSRAQKIENITQKIKKDRFKTNDTNKRKKLNEEKNGLKKIMKKNQVVILTLALMLMTAGYMNYTNNHENENLLLGQLGDARLVSTNVVNENDLNNISNENNLSNIDEEINKLNEVNENIVNNNIVEQNNIQESKAEVNEIKISTNVVNKEEVIDTSNTSNGSKESIDDYFTKSKLERDSMYSQMLETYKGILENDKIPSDQKGIAQNEIKNINDKKNAIMIVENLIQTKGFKNVIIFINDPSVNVIIMKDKLEENEVAQIQNIVQRELKTDIENIHITSKKQ